MNKLGNFKDNFKGFDKEEVFTVDFFYNILSNYALNNDFQLFCDALMLEDKSDILCTLSIDITLAASFKTYGSLVWFLYKINLNIVALGVSMKKKTDKKWKNLTRREFVTNPVLTVKLKKGYEVLLLMKKG